MKHVANRGQTAARCLRAAAELELRSGALYLRVAAREGTPGWLGELLAGLAREEEQHAMRIRLLERLVPPDAWPEHAVARVVDELRTAHGEIVRLEVELDRPGALAPRKILDALSAVERTVDALHAEMVASTLSPQVAALFQGLRSQDARHRELLGDARGNRPR